MNEKKLFASSYFLHFQRTSLVEDRSVLVSSCYSFISIHSEGTTLHHTSVSLVILYEILESESLSSVLLDTFHDALTADGALADKKLVGGEGQRFAFHDSQECVNLFNCQ